MLSDKITDSGLQPDEETIQKFLNDPLIIFDNVKEYVNIELIWIQHN